MRPRTAEGKVAHPRRTYNLEMKRFEICDATLMTRSASSIFASFIWGTRAKKMTKMAVMAQMAKMTQEIQATGKPPAGVPRRSSLALWSLEGEPEFRFRRRRALQHRDILEILEANKQTAHRIEDRH